MLKQTTGGHGGPAKALEILVAMRWLDRADDHTWRICHYLGGDAQTAAIQKSGASVTRFGFGGCIGWGFTP